VIVFLDFSKTRGSKCRDSDYEKWYARPHDSECLMGHRVRGSAWDSLREGKELC
jgi:hypothetical protein